MNQVEDEFNGYGDVTAEYQAVNGGVNIGTTPVVQYTYSNGGNNAEQLLSTVYPDGYTVKDNYSGTTDNAISRISSLTDGNGNLIEGYTYQGVDTVLGRTQAVQSLSTTLDNFGNVAEQKWTSGTTVNSDYKYTYDADNNVVSRADQVDPTRSQTYSYDGLNQLVSYTEGGAGAQSYSYDTLGNRLGVTTGGSTVTSGANAQNQVTNVDGTPLSYDNDGNMTKDQNGANYYWDAWNRLVVIATNTTVESFSYDGESRLVTDTVATTAGGTTTNRYYSNQDQVLDESVGSNWTARYVWSPVYVNALIFRDTLASGTRVWAEQDANYNVVALVGASGAVMERIDYSGFGVETVYSGNVAGWVYGFQGMRLDSVTGWVESESRWYSPSLGSWTSVDPLGFGGGDTDIYGAFAENPINKLDPSGTNTIEVIKSKDLAKLPDGGNVTLPNGVKGKVEVFVDAETKHKNSDGKVVDASDHDIVIKLTAPKSCNQCHWLQFVMTTKVEDGKEVTGVYETKNSYLKYGTRYVDSLDPTDPFYDARAAHELSGTVSAIADEPDVQAGVRVTFDDFLICGGKVAYHVHWERVGVQMADGLSRNYENITGEAVNKLPKWAAGDELPRGYSDKAATNEQPRYKNPVDKASR